MLKLITTSRQAREHEARRKIAVAEMMGPQWCATDKATGRCIRPDHDPAACARKRRVIG